MKDRSLSSEDAGPVSVTVCPQDYSVEMGYDDSKEEENLPESSEL
jgi:hypothetical protein